MPHSISATHNTIKLPLLNGNKTNSISATINDKAFTVQPEFISGGYDEAGETRYSFGAGPFPDDSNLAMIYITLNVKAHSDGTEYSLEDASCPVKCYFTDKYEEGGNAYAATTGTVKFNHSLETYVMEGIFSFEVEIPAEGKAPAKYSVSNGELYVGPSQKSS